MYRPCKITNLEAEKKKSKLEPKSVKEWSIDLKVLQWTLVITNSLGPVKLLCYIEMLLYLGCKNNEIQRNFLLWDQENYFFISGFCSVFFYNESPM